MAVERDVMPARVRVPRAVLIAAAALAVLQCALFSGVRRDDAFISFRYGQNLSRGLGLVFNPGEHVMGSTSPGHVLLAALMHRLVGDQLLPSLMSALGCIGWTAQALAIGVLLTRALPLRAAWSIALAVALGAGRAQEHVPLETTIVAGLTAWAIVFGLAERWYACAALGALACLFRPDMYVPIGLLAVWCVWRVRAQAWKPALLFAALSAPWYLYAYSAFGTLLAESARTKYHQRPLADYALFELRQNGLIALPFAHPLWIDALACGLSAFGAFVLVKRAPRLWLLPAWWLLHNVAYLFLRPFTHTWHLYPVASLSAVLMLTGLYAAAGGLRARELLALVPVALFALAYGVTAREFAYSHEYGLSHGARDHVHRAVAGYLRAHARATDLVASIEVGTVAYYSNLTMYDWGGLVTPNAIFRPKDRRLNWAMVDQTTPELGVAQTPLKKFQSGAFWVKLYNFELLQLAALRVAYKTGPSFKLRRLKQDLQPVYERELLDLGNDLDHSGLRINAFLATHTPR